MVVDWTAHLLRVNALLAIWTEGRAMKIAALAAALALAAGIAGTASAHVTTETGVVDTSSWIIKTSPQGVIQITGSYSLPTPVVLNATDGVLFEFKLSSPINDLIGNDIYNAYEYTPVGTSGLLEIITAVGPASLAEAYGWPVLPGYSGTVLYGDIGYAALGNTPPPTTVSGPFSFTAQILPEPATWLMTIIGVGLLGVALRRRQAADSIANIRTA
jgi:hypothetical protein